jgi:hypothetical protein
MGSKGLSPNLRCSLLAENCKLKGFLPVVKHSVKGGHAGAVDHNVIFGIAPDICNTFSRIKIIKLDLSIGSDYF